jgi:hypothetical protein
MKFYREEAKRILAVQKNLSTVVMNASVRIGECAELKNVDSKENR